jgi:hypothetical protein
MKIIKILLGSLAALWGLGILLKLLRNLPFIFSNSLGVSRLLGAVAGMIIAGLICYVCFKDVFKHSTNTSDQSQP